jgi:hypothetical protein
MPKEKNVQRAKVENLIAAWGSAQKIMSPSSSLLMNEADVHPQLQQLSVLSSRQEYWDCAVCALGFAKTKSMNVVDLLATTTEDAKANMTSQQTRDFLDYCKDVSSVGEESLSIAAGVISNVIGITQFEPALLLDFETCYELCGDDETCMTTCLANKVKTYA